MTDSEYWNLLQARDAAYEAWLATPTVALYMVYSGLEKQLRDERTQRAKARMQA